MAAQESEAFYLAAVTQNGRELTYIPERRRTAKLCLAAVAQNGLALQYVPEGRKTPELCLAAVAQNGLALKYVPEGLKTPELCLTAVAQNGLALQYIPERLKTRKLRLAAVKLCLAAVAQNGQALQCVPNDLKTPELCLAAVAQNERAGTAYVPKGLNLAAVTQRGAAAHIPATLEIPETYEAAEILQPVSPAEVPPPMAAILPELIEKEYFSALNESQGEIDPVEIDEDRQEEAIKGRTSMGATTKDQMVKSRRGQELFKDNIRLNEKGCRVTGITDPQHLRASHMKPWKDSNDDEKLNGCNGLLLAPHIDHLFDKGHISFADNGDLLISPQLDRVVLEKWGIAEVTNVGRFRAEQAVFLDYHRCVIFRK